MNLTIGSLLPPIRRSRGRAGTRAGLRWPIPTLTVLVTAVLAGGLLVMAPRGPIATTAVLAKHFDPPAPLLDTSVPAARTVSFPDAAETEPVSTF